MTLIEALCASILAFGIGDSSSRGEYACTHVPQIVEVSQKFNLRPEVMISLIHYESRFNPRVVSSAGACGLTQVLPRYTGGRPYPRGTGNPRLTCEQLKDPRTSILAGARALRYWLHRYGRGSERVGLCGYNAGFRCKGQTPHRAGMRYSRRVIRMADRMERYVNSRVSTRTR